MKKSLRSKFIVFGMLFIVILGIWGLGDLVVEASVEEGNKIICDSIEEAADCIRAQLVARKPTFSVWYTKDFYANIQRSKIREEVYAYTEECSGQEGDALQCIWYSESAVSKEGDYVRIDYTGDYNTTAEQEEELSIAVAKVMQELDLEGKMEYEKVKAVHDYICTHVKYDYSYSNRTAYDALCNKSSVCEGYARLFYRLAKEAGLSVRYISGTADNGCGGGPEGHAWNIVQIGGRYYNVDCTWDVGRPYADHDYFLKNDYADHWRDEAYLTEEFMKAYPMAEEPWGYYDQIGFFNKSPSSSKFETVDGATVTSESKNGKGKVLIFYTLSSEKSISLLKEIGSGTMEDADVIAIEVEKNSREDVTKLRDECGGNHITFTYCTEQKDYDTLKYYAREWQTFIKSIKVPFVVYIDTDNKYQYCTMGETDLATIHKNVEIYCDKNRLVVPTATTLNKSDVTLEVGQTEQVTGSVVPANATMQTLGYESTDKSVVRVDSNGKITAVAPGTAKIIAYNIKVKDAQMAYCTVTVKEAAKNPFADVKRTGWEYYFAKYVYEKGLMAGKGTDANGNIIFDPNKAIPREEFVQVLYNASGKPAVSIENQFPDVKDAWYKNAVLWAKEQGIAKGQGDGTFGISKNITRQDLALMLYKYANLNGYDLTANPGEINKYADGSKVSGYAQTAMDWAITKGVLSGKGTKGEDISTFRLDPAGTATRAECAAMLKNFMEAYGK